NLRLSSPPKLKPLGSGKSEDLRMLKEKEVPGYMENQKDPMAIDRIMKNLQECWDGKISFEGYLFLFAGLTNGCNEYYIKKMKSTGKKKT
uniref:S100 calcium-binding protein A10 n=1 Tax=Pseudonaja textilis TaxID=8673 RepID=A0A670Z1I9_PSETE